MKTRSLLKVAAALALMTGSSLFAQAISSGSTDVTLNGTVQETLTISLDQTAISFVLVPGSATNAGNTSVNVTTTWNLLSGRNAVALYAYFDNPISALANGSSAIPSANVSATVGGSSVGSFTNVVPFGTGVTLMSQSITSANLSGVKTSTVSLNIDLSSFSTLPAGTYSGTLHFQAQATP